MIYSTDENTYFNDVKLKQNIAIPSIAHSYGLAVEFMKYWFLKEFPEGYFKSVYIDGKYIFDDFREFNKNFPITKEKPMLAIQPTINTEYDRDHIDLFEGGREILTRRTKFFNEGFFKDYEHNQFLGIRMKQLELNFVFKIRVSTRSQQLDLLEYMRLALKSGVTQGKYINMDIHVPYEIMLNIAQDCGYEIIEDCNGRPRVKEICEFMSYLNSHSQIPFLYKFRSTNGNSEFFIRIKDAFLRIYNLENIEKDDGETIGQDMFNFHLEMNTILHFPAPAFYYYYTNKTLEEKYKERNELLRLYSFDVLDVEPPNTDEHGWRQYISTEYIFDNITDREIEFVELLEESNLMKVIKNHVKSGLSPEIFLNIKIYHANEPCDIKIDWEKYKIIINKEEFKDPRVAITIYIDLEYFNNQLMLIDSNKRINENNK